MNLANRLRANLPALTVVIGLFAFRSSLADQYVIPTGSMEPTIQVGDHVWVNKFAYDLRIPFTHLTLGRVSEPRRGDVVVFEDPRDHSINLIKRLVGLPGDRLRIVDGVLEVNGKAVETSLGNLAEIENALNQAPAAFEYDEKLDSIRHRVQRIPWMSQHRIQEVTVPDGRYFFMGDNRDNSSDSRVWGFASREALRGKAMRVIYNVHWKGWMPIPGFERSGLPL